MKARFAPNTKLTHAELGDVSVLSSNFRIGANGYHTTYTVVDAKGIKHTLIGENTLKLPKAGKKPGKTTKPSMTRGTGKKEKTMSAACTKATAVYVELFAAEVPPAYVNDTKWIKAEIKAKKKAMKDSTNTQEASVALDAQTRIDYKEKVGEEAPTDMTLEAMQDAITKAMDESEKIEE